MSSPLRMFETGLSGLRCVVGKWNAEDESGEQCRIASDRGEAKASPLLRFIMQFAAFSYLRVEKVLTQSPFKNPKCKEQKKFKIEAYLFIRVSLNFLQ
ncbi:MAG: hypothetical protein EA399_15970 [Desulfovibrionales bacterium]|nr:MAG: hypothetical protein EA399_15970 [Desulfovibrionales bacterium]